MSRHEVAPGASRPTWLGVIVAAFLLMCASLGPLAGAVPPLLGRIGADLGMNEVAQGALTSIPALCVGLVMPFASRLVGRTGINTAGTLMLVGLVLGAVVRVSGGTVAAFAGTVLMGACVAVGHLIAPIIIGRDFWSRTSLMTGLYSATGNLMVTVCTALAVPVAVVIGWRGSTLVWSAGTALVALAAWLWVFPHGAPGVRESLRVRSGMSGWVTAEAVTGAEEDADGRLPVWRRPLTWVMALAFAAHVFAYVAVVSWLPTALGELNGMGEADAGLAASVFTLMGIVGPLLVPVMFDALRWSGTRVLGVLSACWLALPVCLVVAPGLWLVPCALSGIAQAGYFVALFTIVIRRSRDLEENRQTTATLHTVANLVGALGPVTTGWLRTATGGWVVPFLMVVVVLAVMTLCGQLAASRRGSQWLDSLARVPRGGQVGA